MQTISLETSPRNGSVHPDIEAQPHALETRPESRLSLTMEEGDRLVQVDENGIHSALPSPFQPSPSSWPRWFSESTSTPILSMFKSKRRPSLVPLLTDTTDDDDVSIRSALPPPGKARCWCCWESYETSNNPLVRVCMGCKDPDLQWIHQECVNKYVTGLPGAMNTQESSRRASVNSLVSNNSETDGLLESNMEQGLTITTKSPEFYCTRCKDPYHVVHTPIHPFRILIRDPFLIAAMTLMTLCMTVLTTCCIVLIAQHWGTGHVLFDLGVPWLRLGMTTFACFMLVFCHSVNAVTWSMVISHCSGQTTKQVTPIMVDPMTEPEHDVVQD